MGECKAGKKHHEIFQGKKKIMKFYITTSTRPSSSPSYYTPHRHGGTLPARPTSNASKQLTVRAIQLGLGLQLTILGRLNSLLTWTTTFLRT